MIILLAVPVLLIIILQFSELYSLNQLAQRINNPALITSILVLSSIFVFRKKLNLTDIINTLVMNLRYRFNTARDSLGAGRSRFAKLKEHKFAMANGGVIGGISNDGNTCFMNSVLQSLASSRELTRFIDEYVNESEKLTFTQALKTLLDNINGSYGPTGKGFSTRPLLNKMPNGPKQNFFSGYNQEDAQEFYQLVMSILEKEHKIVKPTKKTATKFVKKSDLETAVDFDDLSQIGTVCVPALQVDPNLDNTEMVYPLNLITPVDGISAERIGCLTCGEVGGIRYSVNSGLSLNLPNSTSYYHTYELADLLKEWITPEIIEDVNCNRCGLNQTKTFLLEKLSSMDTASPLYKQFQSRLDLIDEELRKHYIEDEVFEKLTIKQMIKKSKKSKQIYLSRPPPLLAIHINRSVFDPRTYLIVKNPSNVTFPSKLNLADYVAEPQHVNMDARKTFRKQDEGKVFDKEDDSEAETESLESEKNDFGSNLETHVNGGVENVQTNGGVEDIQTNGGVEDVQTNGVLENVNGLEASGGDVNHSNGIAEDSLAQNEKISNSNVEESPVIPYNLKAVVSHYGTHNYGHYICYRKYRGTWWRVSDETVHVVREEEVLDGRGTFMLFYERDDGFVEKLNEVEESEEEEEEDDENSESERNSDSESDDQADTALILEERPTSESTGIFSREVASDADYHMGEERVHL